MNNPGLYHQIQQLEMRMHKLNDKISAQQSEINKLKKALEEKNASGK
jgi:flagellar biosynthesis chaperone FliJ